VQRLKVTFFISLFLFAAAVGGAGDAIVWGS
jgi:hypothetical protein